MDYLSYFKKIAAIPHVSGHTEEIRSYLVDFASAHHLHYVTDPANNVIIYKKGSSGYENLPPVILQGHTDMVGAKTAASTHDFLTDPLELVYDGDWLYAKDTSLGGDDGIAVAMILSILADDTLTHPPVEAVFTTEEEVGMDGAKALDYTKLKGRRMINIDSDEEGVLTAGCAGSGRVDMVFRIKRKPCTGLKCKIRIDGLKGGHSGVQINEGLANAIKLTGEVLTELAASTDAAVVAICSGEKDNVIPSEAEITLIIRPEERETIEALLSDMADYFHDAYKDTDENITVSVDIDDTMTDTSVITDEDLFNVVSLLEFIPYGPQSMSRIKADLVQTSANPGIFRLEEDSFLTVVSVRSSITAERDQIIFDLINTIKTNGGHANARGLTSPWEYNKNSPLRETMCRIYKDMFKQEMKVDVIHAGLECGCFSEHLPGLDAVSIGPDMKDIHSANEKLSLSSCERTYNYLLTVLESLCS